ncbi:MAG: DMT family protein [Myxococcota bacterium]
MSTIGPPILLFISSIIMSLAWLGHLRFRHWSLNYALFASWLLVLPEYLLNVYATRWGHAIYTGAQMATFNLATGVVCVALVSKFVLKEELTRRQIVGFVMMTCSVALIMYR